MRGLMRDLDANKTPACPERHMVWAQGIGVDYRQAK
jgi:hypothetical protein